MNNYLSMGNGLPFFLGRTASFIAVMLFAETIKYGCLSVILNHLVNIRFSH